MRRLYQFLAGILAIIFFPSISAYTCRVVQEIKPDKLVIYNWGDYIDLDLFIQVC